MNHYCLNSITKVVLLWPILLFRVELRPLTDTRESVNTTSEEWVRCAGQSCDDWNLAQQKITLLQLQETGDQFTNTNDQTANFSDIPPMDTDILLTPDQVELLSHHHTNRVRRKINSDLSTRWKFPIVYKFDGTHTTDQMASIQAAIGIWQQNTCARFRFASTAEQVNDTYLVFTQQPLSGCASYVGRLKAMTAQPIYLSLACFQRPGIPVHEIGHALGLWHEHQIPNRDSFIKILFENVPLGYYGNFAIVTSVDDQGIPYDFNSVMHYAESTGSNKPGANTIMPLDSIFSGNVGQREELSYLDAKAINLAYCQDTCSPSILPKPCQNGGYQNPNDCSRCTCPAEFDGVDCSSVRRSSDGCGGELFINDHSTVNIEVPKLSTGGYAYNTSCNWIFRSSLTSKLVWAFNGNIDIYAEDNICRHWVEVKFRSDMASPGGRFCSPWQWRSNITSQSNILSASFRTMAVPINNWPNKGFTAKVSAVPSSEVISPKSTTSTEQSTVTTTATTTAKPTTTTTTATQTTRTTTDTAPKSESTTSRATTTAATTQNTTTAPGDGGDSWSIWSDCYGMDCKCGGCSQQNRYRLCNGVACGVPQTRPCDRICTSGDTERIWVGRFYKRDCPTCCQGYKPNGDRCILQ